MTFGNVIKIHVLSFLKVRSLNFEHKLSNINRYWPGASGVDNDAECLKLRIGDVP